MDNVKLANLSLLLMVLFSLVACGGNSQVVYVPAPEPRDVSQFQHQAEQKLNTFCEHIRQGRFEPATMIATDLLTRYESRNLQLETAIYTDLCLCALESAGDMEGFARYAEKLRGVTMGQEVLPKETQFILELSEYLNSSRITRRDSRIAADLCEGIDNIFQ